MNMAASTSKARPAAWSAVEQEPLPASIPALLDRAAELYADRALWESVDGDGQVLSYAAFRDSSVRIAQHLRQKGIGPRTYVALMLPNVAAFMLTWIALCRLGAVAVLVNTSSTGPELERLVRETDVDLLIIHQDFLPVFYATAAQDRLPSDRLVVLTDGSADVSGASLWHSLLESRADALQLAPVALDDIASIQFTSGSSGVPKGCMLSHRYWLTIGKARSCVGPAPERLLIDTPLFYMGPLWRFMMALYCGSTLCVAPRFSLSKLFDRIIENRIDVCLVTYPVAKLPPDPRLASTSLKWLVTYGLNKDLHAALEERFGVPVREVYGMTELGSGLSMPVADKTMVGSGSCGVPAPFRRCRIVVDGKDVADGTPGELWMAGPGMFSGYYRNDEATRDAFEGEWFKTGDLFARDANGYYTMMGRIKDVIRRSGENISAAEIELTANAIDGVLEAAAIPVPDALRGEEVKLVLVRAPGPAGVELTPASVIGACERALSGFKVPRYVEFVDAIPKTSTGKIDKNTLKTRLPNLDAEVFDTRPDKKRT